MNSLISYQFGQMIYTPNLKGGKKIYGNLQTCPHGFKPLIIYLDLSLNFIYYISMYCWRAWYFFAFLVQVTAMQVHTWKLKVYLGKWKHCHTTLRNYDRIGSNRYHMTQLHCSCKQTLSQHRAYIYWMNPSHVFQLDCYMSIHLTSMYVPSPTTSVSSSRRYCLG
jgi:hypothetical protein